MKHSWKTGVRPSSVKDALQRSSMKTVMQFIANAGMYATMEGVTLALLACTLASLSLETVSLITGPAIMQMASAVPSPSFDLGETTTKDMQACKQGVRTSPLDQGDAQRRERSSVVGLSWHSGPDVASDSYCLQQVFFAVVIESSHPHNVALCRSDLNQQSSALITTSAMHGNAAPASNPRPCPSG